MAALSARLTFADERIAAQNARIAALEARLSQQTRPPLAIHPSALGRTEAEREGALGCGQDFIEIALAMTVA